MILTRDEYRRGIRPAYRYADSGGNVDYLVAEQMIAARPHITVGEVAQAIMESDQYDHAIPADFVNTVRDATGFDLSCNAVTWYGDADGIVTVLPLTLDGARALYGDDQVRHDLEELLLLDASEGLICDPASADMARECLARLER